MDEIRRALEHKASVKEGNYEPVYKACRKVGEGVVRGLITRRPERKDCRRSQETIWSSSGNWGSGGKSCFMTTSVHAVANALRLKRLSNATTLTDKHYPPEGRFPPPPAKLADKDYGAYFGFGLGKSISPAIWRDIFMISSTRVLTCEQSLGAD